jgi:hypothetical protein
MTSTVDQAGDVHDIEGKYAPKSQTGPEVRLESDPSVGTFLFPPVRFDHVDHYLDFWAKVPISDGVLSNVVAGYKDLIGRQANLFSMDWGHKYDNAHSKQLHHANATTKSQALAAREEAYLSAMVDWHETRPAVIHAASARQIVRAAQVSYYRSSQSPSDAALVQSSEVAMFSSTLTVDELCEKYQLYKLRDSFCEPDSTSASRLEDLRLEIRNLGRS